MDLKPIKDALKAATPGPWVDDQTEIDGDTVAYIWSPSANEAVGSVKGVYPWDVALLVNAPTWLAALVAEVERARMAAHQAAKYTHQGRPELAMVCLKRIAQPAGSEVANG